jgi:heavy metal sensor kinase
MRRLSIGVRLTLSYLFVFAVAQLSFGVGMWVILRQNLYGIADDALEEQIDDMKHFLEAQRKDASVAKFQEEIGEAYVLEHSGDYLQVQDQDGQWLYRASFLERNKLPLASANQLQKPLFENLEVSGREFRFLTQIIEVNGRRFIVQTGVPEKDILRTLDSFRRNLLIFALLMLVLASGVGYWLSRKALAPVDAITRTACSITGANLSSRLEQLNTGDELQRLSDTLNEMLSRIEAAFQRVSQFTADASHELRTPISLMRIEAEIALRKSRDKGEYQEALRHILVEAERTSVLIENLLSLARADAGRESLDIRNLDFRDIVQNAANNWRRPIAAQGLAFTEDVEKDNLFVAADKTALARLVNILIDNAVKYTPSPGSIELRLEQRNGKALLAVRDTGVGISTEEQTRIFERFYRADEARTRESGGAGLGLAIARWIVEQHRGSITVTSAPGAGSTFVVQLPIAADGTPASISTARAEAVDKSR